MYDVGQLPTLATDVKRIVFIEKLLRTGENRSTDESDFVNPTTPGYELSPKSYNLPADTAIALELGVSAPTIQDPYHPSQVRFLQELNEFTIISSEEKSIRFADLVSTKVDKLFPPQFTDKLKQVLKNLKEMEPMLYKSLLETNNEIDIEEILSLLEFLGADSLPDDLDIEELFEEAKSLSYGK
jgi:hypothetical protein